MLAYQVLLRTILYEMAHRIIIKMGISESVALVNGFFISANAYCSFVGMASMNGEMSELQ